MRGNKEARMQVWNRSPAVCLMLVMMLQLDHVTPTPFLEATERFWWWWRSSCWATWQESCHCANLSMPLLRTGAVFSSDSLCCTQEQRQSSWPHALGEGVSHLLLLDSSLLPMKCKNPLDLLSTHLPSEAYSLVALAKHSLLVGRCH